MSRLGLTLSRHIMEQQREYPGATGDFTGLLTQIALAGKVIAREVNKAGLVNILGFTGAQNVQGEQVTKLDVFAHRDARRGTRSERACLCHGLRGSCGADPAGA